MNVTLGRSLSVGFVLLVITAFSSIAACGKKDDSTSVPPLVQMLDVESIDHFLNTGSETANEADYGPFAGSFYEATVKVKKYGSDYPDWLDRLSVTVNGESLAPLDISSYDPSRSSFKIRTNKLADREFTFVLTADGVSTEIGPLSIVSAAIVSPPASLQKSAINVIKWEGEPLELPIKGHPVDIRVIDSAKNSVDELAFSSVRNVEEQTLTFIPDDLSGIGHENAFMFVRRVAAQELESGEAISSTFHGPWASVKVLP